MASIPETLGACQGIAMHLLKCSEWLLAGPIKSHPLFGFLHMTVSESMMGESAHEKKKCLCHVHRNALLLNS